MIEISNDQIVLKILNVALLLKDLSSLYEFIATITCSVITE
jgi:hypothetical protein